MNLETFLKDISDEIEKINDTSFSVEVIETETVSRTDDKDITYENFESKVKKVKVITTCVLYIDIRKSTNISLNHTPKTLSKLYSSFVRSMVKAAKYYDGHVRNIIGDRVMVVFDSKDCFTNAVNTAILMNTISTRIINKYFKMDEVKCGIGIDYGKMLVTKVGTVVQGADNPEYKSLVWLGKPANIASKLTDIANKTYDNSYDYIHCGCYFPLTEVWSWTKITCEEFLKDLTNVRHDSLLKHTNDYFYAFYLNTVERKFESEAILMSETVYDEFSKANPTATSITNKLWDICDVKVDGYSGKIYSGNIIFAAIDNI